ncbi:FtsX-like permease family protein [Defluviitalea phaphyphila]|uniref:FtsX-like permease family protein n=1 Tax=Defluviitalea phaphyphila TaxID=1473580 RepID=UPI000731AC27|nr:ABC transporter permease [Defluviitalea phaphyphila]
MFAVIKRYSNVSVLIIICFFSAFIALYNGITSTLQVVHTIREKNEYVYRNQVRATIFLPKPISPQELLMLMKDVDTCNVVLDNMPLYFDQIDNVFNPEVVLKQNEPFSLPSSERIDSLKKFSLIASETTIKGNKKLSINGITFDIQNILDDKTYPFVNNLFIINGEDYFYIFPNRIDEQDRLYINIYSNKNNVYSAYTKIQKSLEELIPEARITSSDVITRENIFEGVFNQDNVIFIGLFAFALLNTIILSYYWVVVRRHEIAIRKAFGYTNFSVIVLLSKELFQLIFISAILSIITGISLSFTQIQNFEKFVPMAIGFIIAMGIAVIISMIIPAVYILNLQPSEGVKL